MNKKKSIFILFVIFIFLVVWLLSKLDIWTIQTIKVKNNIFVTNKSLIQQASTVNYGDNILYYPCAKIRKQLLKDIPQLRKVTIK